MKPENFNHEDLQKVMRPTRKWQEELLQTYEGYLCESLSTLRPKRCELTDWYRVDVEEFAIASSYQQTQAYGRLLLQDVVASAKEKGLSVALTAAAGTFIFLDILGVIAHSSS
jgi:hypothetical protein